MEAFTFRSRVKARDAYDIRLLVESGATLDANLKMHLRDSLGWREIEGEDIQNRIADVTEDLCRAELMEFLPERIYEPLAEARFQPLAEMRYSSFSRSGFETRNSIWAAVLAKDAKTKAIISSQEFAKKHKLPVHSVVVSLGRQQKRGLVERVRSTIYLNKLSAGFSPKDVVHQIDPGAYVLPGLRSGGVGNFHAESDRIDLRERVQDPNHKKPVGVYQIQEN